MYKKVLVIFLTCILSFTVIGLAAEYNATVIDKSGEKFKVTEIHAHEYNSNDRRFFELRRGNSKNLIEFYKVKELNFKNKLKKNNDAIVTLTNGRKVKVNMNKSSWRLEGTTFIGDNWECELDKIDKIIFKHNNGKKYICSQCNKSFYTDWSYCPYCGKELVAFNNS